MQFNIDAIKVFFSEKAGNIVFDIVAILILPAIVALGYYFWSSSNDSELLSLIVTKQDSKEFGVKAKESLNKLKSISMDTSLFEDPAYLSLKEFRVDIDTDISLGRTYPFTPPDVLRNKLRTAAVSSEQ